MSKEVVGRYKYHREQLNSALLELERAIMEFVNPVDLGRALGRVTKEVSRLHTDLGYIIQDHEKELEEPLTVHPIPADVPEGRR